MNFGPTNQTPNYCQVGHLFWGNRHPSLERLEHIPVKFRGQITDSLLCTRIKLRYPLAKVN